MRECKSLTKPKSRLSVRPFVELVPGLAQFFYLFGVLRRFQHCTGHITTGSWKGRENQYIQLIKVLYCKLLTNGTGLAQD